MHSNVGGFLDLLVGVELCCSDSVRLIAVAVDKEEYGKAGYDEKRDAANDAAGDGSRIQMLCANCRGVADIIFSSVLVLSDSQNRFLVNTNGDVTGGAKPDAMLKTSNAPRFPPASNELRLIVSFG